MCLASPSMCIFDARAAVAGEKAFQAQRRREARVQPHDCTSPEDLSVQILPRLVRAGVEGPPGCPAHTPLASIAASIPWSSRIAGFRAAASLASSSRQHVRISASHSARRCGAGRECLPRSVRMPKGMRRKRDGIVGSSSHPKQSHFVMPNIPRVPAPLGWSAIACLQVVDTRTGGDVEAVETGWPIA